MLEKDIRVRAHTEDAVKDIERVGDALDNVAKSEQKVHQESQKASKGLQDVADNGGAMAVLDELTGGLATKVKDVAESTKLFNLSLKGTRTALIATGIGAFVVALGLIVAYWDDIVDYITGANVSLEEQLALVQRNQDFLKSEVGLLDKQIELQELQGKGTEELQKQRLALLKQIQAQRDEEIRILEGQLKRLEATSTELSLWEQIKLATTQAFLGAEASAKMTSNLAGERMQAINDLKKAINEAKTEAIDLEIALYKIQNPEGDKEERPKDLTVASSLDVTTSPELVQKKALDELIIKEENTFQERLNALRRAWDVQGLNASKVAEEQRLAIYSQSIDTLAGIMKEGSALGKGFAIAQVVRDQVASISQIVSNLGIANTKAIAISPLTGGQPMVTYNTIQAGLSATASISGAVRAIRDITSDKMAPSGGQIGAGGGGAGGRGAPAFNLVEGTGTNLLAESINGNAQANKVYVLSRDVTTAQELDRNIEATSSL